MEEKKKIFDIKERTLNFAVEIVKFTNSIFNSKSLIQIGNQMLRSGTSIGANLEEAYGAVSKKDFINKIGIARKEARETTYWLKLTDKADLLRNSKNIEILKILLTESDEIAKILSSIIIKARRNP